MGDKEQHKHRHKRWYAYVHGNPLNSENYQLVSVQSNCWSGRDICAIMLTDMRISLLNSPTNLKHI